MISWKEKKHELEEYLKMSIERLIKTAINSSNNNHEKKNNDMDNNLIDERRTLYMS